MIKDEADEGPHAEVQPRCRRDEGEAAEEDGKVDLAPEGVGWPLPREEVDGDGGQSAEEERPDQWLVEGSRAEEAGGADDAPKDGAVEVDACERAGEAVEGVGGAEEGMWENIQFRTPIWVRELMTVARSWTVKSSRGGIFM